MVMRTATTRGIAVLNRVCNAAWMETNANNTEAPLPLLSTREAAKLLGLSVSTLTKYRVRERGPSYIKIGKRILYTAPDLEAWVMANRHSIF